jgi:hypothetical protein
VSKQKLFLGGVPTAPDIKAIEDAVGLPGEGALVSWEMLEKILNKNRGEHRFKTVVTAWRKKLMRDHNVLMVARGGEGLVAATPDERIDYGSRQQKIGVRHIRRGAVVAALTDGTRLTAPKAKEVRAFLVDVPNRLRLIEATTRK